MENERDELAMVDEDAQRRWEQSTCNKLTPDDILAAFAGLPDAPRAIAAYEVRESRWDWAMTFNSVLGTLPSTPIAINNVAPPGRLWRRYQRNCARRARDVRLQQRKLRLARRQRRAQQRKHQQGKA